MKRFTHRSVHYAWFVLGLTFLATLVGAGIRSAASALIHPLEAEFGWGRAAIASAFGLNLLVYGIAAPISGHLFDRYGPRRVVLASLFLLATGTGLTVIMTTFWHLVLVWGLVVGLGAGAMASVLAATVANRWFVARRGLALGIMNSAFSTGQLLFLPLLMTLIVASGWRAASLVMAAAVAGLIPLIALWMRDEPKDMGLRPYGAAASDGPLERSAGVAADPDPPRPSLAAVVHSPTFWLLAGSFFICGATSNGLIGTHLIPHSIEHGIPQVTAATMLGVMGGMNFVGTLLSGWLVDRISPRAILSVAFLLRGASLFVLPFVDSFSGLFVFAVIYGLDWFATVPPVVTLTADTFGRRSIGTVYGWIFLSHQVGGALTAAGGGVLRAWLGDYQLAFLLGGILAVLGAGLALGIPSKARAAPAAAVATSEMAVPS
jgi:sugar phosphate permease